ncbi:hypothetical protein HELRODRAFT_152053, partial [Helobdella robusta]|uniref:LRRNT domain-containing protein n=1 Tax=Helobdella robusta TaxID=6412 RepID=T1EKN8_HELRO
DCSFSSLYNIPHDIDPETQHLDLSGNQINRLQVKTFKRFSKIQTVNFSNNNMEYIDQKSLLIFVEVKNIDLSHNKLVNISPLMGMPKLKYLNLSYNEITLDIQLKEKFAKPYLLELDLSHNNLIDMKQESLSMFEKIGKLVLS